MVIHRKIILCLLNLEINVRAHIVCGGMLASVNSVIAAKRKRLPVNIFGRHHCLSFIYLFISKTLSVKRSFASLKRFLQTTSKLNDSRIPSLWLVSWLACDL